MAGLRSGLPSRGPAPKIINRQHGQVRFFGPPQRALADGGRAIGHSGSGNGSAIVIIAVNRELWLTS